MYAQSDPDFVSDIVIAGGGYAGISSAIRLMRHARGYMNIFMVEPANIGGIAYSEETADDGHHLNLQAGRISLLREDPNNFINWAKNIKGLELTEYSPVSRKLFGEYCWDTLWQEAAKCPYANLQVCTGKIAGFKEEKDGVAIRTAGDVTLRMSEKLFLKHDPFDMLEVALGYKAMPLKIPSSGQPVKLPEKCDYLVAATGHIEVIKPKALEHITENGHGVIIDQFTGSAYKEMDRIVENIKETDKILILGTGLAGFDAAVSIVKRCEKLDKPVPHFVFSSRNCRRHPIYAEDHLHKALSPPPRPDILDKEHITLQEAEEAFPVIWEQAEKAMMEQDSAALRKNPKLLPERILKAMEPYIAELIQKMSPEDVQDAYNKYWSLITTNRIGMVPKVGNIVLDLEKQGKAEFIAGELDSFSDGHAVIKTKDGTHELDAVLVVNGIGRSFDYTKTENPFWKNADFLPHQKTGMGVAVTEDGNLVHKNGTPYKRVFCCGVMRVGDEIERHGRLGAFTTSQGPTKTQAVQIAHLINRGVSLPLSPVDEYYQFAKGKKGDVLEAFFEKEHKKPLSPEFKAALREIKKDKRFGVGVQHLYAESFHGSPAVAMKNHEEKIIEWLDDTEKLEEFLKRHNVTDFNERVLIQEAPHIVLEEGIAKAMYKCMDVTTDPQTVVKRTVGVGI